MERTESFVLDFSNRNVQEFHVMQHDKDSRVYYIDIKDNNEPVNLTNHIVKVFGVKPDKQPIFNTVDIIDAETGLVKITLTNQMTARNGAMVCILAIYGLDGTEIGTNLFRIMIQGNPRNDEAVESASEFTALTEAILKAERFDVNGQALIDAWELQFQEKYEGLEEEYAQELTNVKTSLEQNVTQINARISEIIATSGDGTIPSELSDIRVNKEGTTFELASDRIFNIEEMLLNGFSESRYTNWVQGVVLSDGSEPTNLTFIRTGLNQISIGSKLKITPINGHNFAIAWYNDSQTFVNRSAFFTTSTELTAQYPYFKLMVGFDGSTPITTERASNIKVYRKIKTYLDDTINTKLEDKLSGKKLLNFGDSIGAGDGNNGTGYCEMLGQKYGMTYYDYAVGGATVAVVAGNTNNILKRINDAITAGLTADYILFNGMANDNSIMTPLGTVSNGFDSTVLDTSTFCGALEKICHLLKTTWIGAKIVYVKVHKMGSRTLNAQKTYGDLATQICEKWSIPIVDVYSEGGLNTFIDSMKQNYTMIKDTAPNGDMTHPNEVGYKTFYVPMIEAKLKSI